MSQIMADFNGGLHFLARETGRRLLLASLCTAALASVSALCYRCARNDP
jgi:hypothetical protein